jgi:hypothetical protein
MSTTSELAKRLDGMFVRFATETEDEAAIRRVATAREAAAGLIDLEDDVVRLHKFATDRYDEIIVLNARLDELERENARLSKWEWIADYDEPERQSDNIVSLAEDLDLHGVMHVSGYREVCRLWIAHRCLSVDDEGEPDETEVVEFKTAEEAKRCWPESFAAARAALAGSGEK